MASTYLQKFPVPEQFPEILHDLLREILREQPDDIIVFAHRYFKDKVEVTAVDLGRRRDEGGREELLRPPGRAAEGREEVRSDLAAEVQRCEGGPVQA